MDLPADLMIVIAEAKSAAEGKDTLEDKLTAAMNSARNHWMVLDEDKQFRGAVGAVMLLVDDETKRRLELEMKSLNALSAMISGVPVDIEQIEVSEDPIGLLKMWKELKKEG